MLRRMGVALDSISRLGLLLKSAGLEPGPERSALPGPGHTLELRGVTHAYYTEDGSRFTLGPINLSIRKGRILFIVGGNGSGKTTLVKVLMGLYPSASGEILIDGRAITDQELDSYRQLFSAVFADFHLFDSLLGLQGPGLDERAGEYLAQLRLEHKVRIQDGVFSTTALSQGQRKRLALLTAYLEDRPFYVFDEWAADQDPLFKEFFYRQLLPALREQGKGVIVISHDDRYFPIADELVRLEDGQLLEPLPALAAR
jgi:putative ATP-binding cassette transporter